MKRDLHSSETDCRKNRVGPWFNPSVFDWMEVDMNVSLQSIVKKRQGFSRLNDWSLLFY